MAKHSIAIIGVSTSQNKSKPQTNTAHPVEKRGPSAVIFCLM